MSQIKKAVILVNVGTPDDPGLKSVRKFLFEFLNDPFVIDLPFILRKLLVNLIIVPFRAPKSAKLYKELWTTNGSPIKYYQESVKKKLSGLLKDEYIVYNAMRYGNPNLKDVLKDCKSKEFEEITLLPLYPQYASSTTESVNKLFMKVVNDWEIIPGIKYICQFYNHPAFIESFAKRVLDFDIDQYDHILFSFHGLPDRHIRKMHPDIKINGCLCEKQMTDYGKFCYKATCYETARLLASKLKIPGEKYSVSFQSRLSKNWLSPFTNQIIKEKTELGIKNMLVIAPSFVTDCLETIIEIEKEYKELFEQNGGKTLDLVKSLNDSDSWIEGLSDIIKNAE